MKIGYTYASGRGDTDLLLYRFAMSLCADGYRPVGTVQMNEMCKQTGRCDMDVKVLPDGPVIRISQALGPGSTGCRLLPSALEESVGEVAARLTREADLLIINKFGKQEADGHGFRPLIGAALELGVPVIVGLSHLNQQAFFDFAEDFAEELAPDEAALRSWFERELAAIRGESQPPAATLDAS
ncbi:DUF2478 domain-containing protein [Marimonas sp. MJW-29]|uniref:DUF2478 domain-containing protein n=1 Tax=Sulfitobacter sediminis TaxID=3234186 RepID=A0ABV3RJR0_9RHOB